MEQATSTQTSVKQMENKTKFCKHCGKSIAEDAVLCVHCGKQVEVLKNDAPQVVINNSNNNMAIANAIGRNARNKWVALALCFFLGFVGAHKFYEGKAGLGVLYIFTFGLFGIGWLVDLITILCRPNPYYV